MRTAITPSSVCNVQSLHLPTMIVPRCTVIKYPAAIVLLATFLGISQAHIHRCLREFESSNCNALEEVWAYDGETKSCIEVVYGGCGEPIHLANRFNSQEECLRSCSNFLAPEHQSQGNRWGGAQNDGRSSSAGTYYGLGRNYGRDRKRSNEPSLKSFDEVRAALNALYSEVGGQPSMETNSARFRQQIPPIHVQQPSPANEQQAMHQPMNGQQQWMGQYPTFGAVQRSQMTGIRNYWGQPQGYLGQPLGYFGKVQGYVPPQNYQRQPQGYPALIPRLPPSFVKPQLKTGGRGLGRISRSRNKAAAQSSGSDRICL